MYRLDFFEKIVDLFFTLTHKLAGFLFSWSGFLIVLLLRLLLSFVVQAGLRRSS
jgi:hypothetical protein